MEITQDQIRGDAEANGAPIDRTELKTREQDSVHGEQGPTWKSSWRIRSIVLMICLLSFMAALDGTIITTSLPTITAEIGGADLYAWIANSYLFASTAPQPFYAQIANVLGRKNPILFAIALFALGSGLAGGAANPTMMIVGRTVQGLGSGGLYVLSDIIVCDAIPPRYRGPYLSAVLSCAGLGSTIGPIIGGALAQANWRWIFWINLPVSGAGLVAIILLLNTTYNRASTWRHALLRIDFVGNAIFIPSMIALYFGLINGGDLYPWNSWRVIMPLVLGICGWAAFHVYEASTFCKEPTMPPRLFQHPTSATGFLIIFICSLTLQAFSYFLPVFFLALKGVSPLTAGVYYLPFSLGILPFAGLAGAFLSKFGKYRPLHWLGMALSAIGFGLISTLTDSSSTAAWVCYQLLVSAGAGTIFTITLPSTLAPLQEADVAVATGTYSFVRSFGLVWGVTIASTAFDSQISAHLDSVRDTAVRNALAGGGAYSLATGGYISSLPSPTQAEVVALFSQALRVVWLVMAAISCAGFFCVFVEKHVPLRQEHETDFGLAEKSDDTRDEEKI